MDIWLLAAYYDFFILMHTIHPASLPRSLRSTICFAGFLCLFKNGELTAHLVASVTAPLWQVYRGAVSAPGRELVDDPQRAQQLFARWTHSRMDTCSGAWLHSLSQSFTSQKMFNTVFFLSSTEKEREVKALSLDQLNDWSPEITH